MPSNFMDDVLEAYHEVMVQPWGEGLVGKKFPWNWYASCRTHGGEAWYEFFCVMELYPSCYCVLYTYASDILCAQVQAE
jgi:hypothetical protein|eukprot:COSAG02_NODE_517_length_20800_cov_18.817497_10_plen_79_part_00